MKSDGNDAEVAVVGGGPAGYTAAIAIAQAGTTVALIRGRTASGDNRTTALLHSSVTALSVLGVWSRCSGQATPLQAMRIVDDTGRLFRAPEVTFRAAEIGLDAFAWNIENRHLVEALAAIAREIPNLAVLEDVVEAVDGSDSGATLRLSGGRHFRARLVVGADGRNSICRQAAHIRVNRRSCPQVALTFNVGHTRPHGNISTEFHTPSGPFTLVPLPGRRSSIVCVVAPRQAERMQSLTGADLGVELERRAHSVVGKMQAEPGVGAFPLAVESAERMAGSRVVLVGEAAHVVPPIGAQGLNLGLRDAATIAELVAAARDKGEDVGGLPVTAAYERERRGDVAGRTLAVDLLNRSLLTDLLPVQGVRGFGLYLLDRIGGLGRALMREGVSPAAAQPKLMRGEPLGPDRA